ncbi:uncharacterized protein V1513DRAFT_444857 [Lipomyces chichibuensis]|uniref:uncharacterized protein n=1 Tax=Lipomyces chichibuensis TaxID=1546026 RepID=UPI0033435B45
MGKQIIPEVKPNAVPYEPVKAPLLTPVDKASLGPVVDQLAWFSLDYSGSRLPSDPLISACHRLPSRRLVDNAKLEPVAGQSGLVLAVFDLLRFQTALLPPVEKRRRNRKWDQVAWFLPFWTHCVSADRPLAPCRERVAGTGSGPSGLVLASLCLLRFQPTLLPTVETLAGTGSDQNCFGHRRNAPLLDPVLRRACPLLSIAFGKLAI